MHDEEVDTKPEREVEDGADVLVSFHKGVVDGPGFDEVLVDHEVALDPHLEALVCVAEQEGCHAREPRPHDQWEEKQAQGRFQQAHEHQQTADLAGNRTSKRKRGEEGNCLKDGVVDRLID